MDEIELNELLELCSNNQKLFDFILGIINREKKAGSPKEDLVAYTSTNWEWDVEDIDEYYDPDEVFEDKWIFAQYNLDWAQDLPDEDPWELLQLEDEFCRYFHGFNFDDIRLDNGDLLFLIDKEDYLAFKMYSKDKIVDNAVDGIRWNMEHLYRTSI